VLQQNGHIRIDPIWQKYPFRFKAIFESCWLLILLIPMALVILIYGGQYAYHSWKIHEVSIYTPWAPPLWHFKAIAPLAALILLLQGIVELIRNILSAVRGKQNES